MRINLRDELRIQSCVDGELSSLETSELLRRLDSLNDGWKTLACGLLENRRLFTVLGSLQAVSSDEDALSAIPSVRRAASSSSDKLKKTVRHWWSHPATSMTLCAAIAFVGGLLIPEFGSTSGHPSRPADLTRYQMRQTPWSGKAVNIPIVPLDELQKEDPLHPLFNSASNQGSDEWRLVQIEDGKWILIPVDQHPSDDMQ